MSHLVLARKWRPRDFETLVGQPHVVRALTHALSTGRLHHAYLLTGTRGVGKTTIARILAKAINCDSGPTPRPCGKCAACTGIDSGRFVDYVEMDAASNRGVDEMTQLLENAIYAPSSARYKVYVIDEVHMLSTHAFNAMLKTLEEPPPHVMFVLATTDPQKVPVTVLSRCLQFNLKNMAPAAIAEHLGRVLEAEAIRFEPAALALLAGSAGGSMRDALSLLDQAISFGGGAVAEADVREMLGAVDHAWIAELLSALAQGDGVRLIGLADQMAQVSAPFERILDELALWLHRIALAQAGIEREDERSEKLAKLAGVFAPEDIQVFYQIVTHGARDLPLAPDPHSGFSMLLLRLLAFRPADGMNPGGGAGGLRQPGEANTARPQSSAGPRRGAQGSSVAAQALEALRSPQAARTAVTDARPRQDEAGMLEPASSDAGSTMAADADLPDRKAAESPIPAVPPVAPPLATPAQPIKSSQSFDGNWPQLARRIAATGLVGQFMEQSELLSASEDEALSFAVRVPIRPMAEPGTVGKVRDRLSQHFGRPVRLQVEVGRVGGVTAAREAEQVRGELLEAAREALESDPFVRSLVSDFGGRILPDSVSPAPGAG
jgi:DNA polymerase-3 subunit gamma/tau